MIKVEVCAPECPTWLADDAKEYWHVLIDHLMATRVVNVIDEKPLARYCQYWSQWCKLNEFINRNGVVHPVKDGEGNIRHFKAFPHVAMRDTISKHMIKFEQEFGLTPSSRSRLTASATAKGSTSDAAKFFGPRPN